jgi:ABC-type Fe3+/spermidine/putrescine transport system ATPase subunit
MEIALEGIGKSYRVDGRPVVGVVGVDLTIPSQGFVTLMGPSGAGKSTLLHLISGALRPDSGRIRFDERDVTSTPAEARPVHTVFQGLHLFPHMNVERNIAFSLEHARGDRPRRSEIRERVDRLLGDVGLRGFGSRRIQELSGGERQRVAIARALIDRPRALLLDEPFAPLDRALKDTLIDLILSIRRAYGVTIVLTTHDWYEALRLSDRIAVIRSGLVVQAGTPQELYLQPRTEAIARLTGPMNILTGRLDGGRFVPGPGDVFGIRPPFVRFGGDLEGTVEEVAYAGDTYHVRLRLDGTTVTAHALAPPPDRGALVRFALPPEHLIRLEADA